MNTIETAASIVFFIVEYLLTNNSSGAKNNISNLRI